MTAVAAENTIMEFKGRMLMMTVLQLSDLDSHALHEQISQRQEEAAQWLQDAPVVLDLAPGVKAESVAMMSAVDTLRGLDVNLVALARSDQMDADMASMVGLGTISLSGGRDVPRRTETSNAPKETTTAAASTQVIDQPVRSGQQVYSRGDLIVLAPVSTGAELMAEGNIHVYNTLRGRALAGVRGNNQARVFCQKLDAELVSIAGHYRVAEDLPDEYRNQAVHVSLHGEAMQFTALN